MTAPPIAWLPNSSTAGPRRISTRSTVSGSTVTAWSAEVFDTSIEPIDCLSRAGRLVGEQYWLFVGITVVAVLIFSAVPLVLNGALMCGIFMCFMARERGERVRFEELFRGTIDGASVYPREVVKTALQHNAAAVILAHNHPSGIAEPSQADRHLTNRLRDALALVDIRVLDHVVIGQGEPVSFAERGWL